MAEQTVDDGSAKVACAPQQAEWMRRAIALARTSAASGGGPFGCVIVRDGELLAEASNAVTRLCDPTAHAEVQAIRLACAALGSHQLEGCQVYSSCEPCPMCLGAIYWARPAMLFFSCGRGDAAAAGFDDAFLYQQIAMPSAQRQIAGQQILAAEGRLAFVDWRNNATKIAY